MRQYLYLLEYQGESALLLKQCCQYLQMELNKKILIVICICEQMGAEIQSSVKFETFDHD
jgi:hypothetical protein